MKKFFSKNGVFNWTGFSLFTLAMVVVSTFFVGSEMWYSLKHRFANSGIWMVLGFAASLGVFYKIMRAYEKNPDATGLNKYILVGWALLFGGLLGPNVGFKEDRKASIPDTAVYYFNGKVINTTDSTKENYYFKHFSLNVEDSVYVITYGEEPGYNDRNGFNLKGVGPRADSSWTRPVTKQAQKFEDNKRLD